MDTDLREVTMRMSARPWSQPIQNIATMRIQITNIKQTLRRDMQGREMICNVQPMGPPTVFFFHVPINILVFCQITSQNHILDHLIFNLNGEPDLCNFMAPNIYSYARRVCGSCSNGFLLSVETEVLWTDLIEEITETTMDVAPSWLRMSTMHQRGMDLAEWLRMHYEYPQEEDEEDEEDNEYSEGVMEKLRRERRVEKTDGSEVGICAICLDDMSDSKDLIDMPCRHIFHDACVFRWLKNHNSCPMCRRPVH